MRLILLPLKQATVDVKHRALTTLITAEAELDCYRKLRTSLQTIVKERKSDEEARAKANNRLETVHKQFEAKRVEREETMKKCFFLYHLLGSVRVSFQAQAYDALSYRDVSSSFPTCSRDR